MAMPTKSAGLLAVALLCCTAASSASEASLSKEILRQDGWVAYDVAMVADAGAPCCYEFHGHVVLHNGCDLDDRNWNIGRNDDDPRPLVADAKLSVYLHVAAAQVDKVRAFASTCALRDAANVRRIDPVDSADSIALLARMSGSAAQKHDVADAQIAALALHADAAATPALIELADSSHPRKLREQALFWLAQMRGAPGAQAVERAATTDADPDLRANAVFALSQAHAVDAYLGIRHIAQHDASEHVREQALFWMAQMGDARARSDIIAAIGSDSSDKVREQGVFALSQLKDHEADAALIAIVRGAYPRKVKEQALFWLGQSGSDEAMKFLDDVLTRQAVR